MPSTRDAKTKILCTLGPSSNDRDTLGKMIEAGMDVVRLNFSHGSYDDHAQSLANARAVAAERGVPLGVLQDLQGPKIRVGELDGPSLGLSTGSRITITTDPVIGTHGRIATSYAGLPRDVGPGEKILLDDGKIQLRVHEVQGNDVVCEVVQGGVLLPRKGINLPGVAVSTPSLTEKDLRDLEFGIRQQVDFVALSFVRKADDVRALRGVMEQRWGKESVKPIIAKIEKPQAVLHIEEIINEADGIMIARGDLGVELPPEEVPVIQKRIIRLCNDAGKPVIVATQMLESMIGNPTPTRAEANDVANAVIDGADAVMLSGETSVGKFPVEAVAMMNRVVLAAEGSGLDRRVAEKGNITHTADMLDALGRAACVLAEQMNAAALVTVTLTGRTARVVARYRPHTPIIAVAASEGTLQALTIVWGVRGFVLQGSDRDVNTAIRAIERQLVGGGLVHRGDAVVLLAGQSFFDGLATNIVRVEKVVG